MKTLRHVIVGLLMSCAVTAGATPTSNIVSSGSKYSGEPKTWTSSPASTATSSYLEPFDTRAFFEWLVMAPDPFAVRGLLIFFR